MIHIDIATDNAAFEGDDLRYEVARILRELALKIEAQGTADEILLRDINGNRVGACRTIDEA